MPLILQTTWTQRPLPGAIHHGSSTDTGQKGLKMRICGNGLIVEEGQCCHRFACNTCPYVHNITRKVTNQKYPKLKEVDDVLGGAAAWENVDSTAEPCPKCEHPRAYLTPLQIHSADEPMTTFYKCCNAQQPSKSLQDFDCILQLRKTLQLGLGRICRRQVTTAS
ncbi:hypothetical protein A6R68_19913 [Neotoma lepida]|uniref:DNA-directed RNA polymerase III subunit RPC10 n=1 Tax=Neotoma lepida TaxID=56216 RepID=A0A1A6HGI4_NEOLE|nr:hypothetical protein A6R68_19913 [Neotoma lepida]